jgi:stalled ribosome rescue protein Dom34
VILALVDSRRGRVFRYSGGQLAEVADLRAGAVIDDLSDRTSSKRACTHSGGRGETGTDAANRMLERESAQLHGAIAERLQQLAGDDAFVLLAGPAAARSSVRGLIGMIPACRVDDDVALPATASAASVRAAVERHASLLTARWQRRLLEGLLAEARPGGRGAVGLQAIRHAVDQGQIECLLVSDDYAARHEQDVEPVLARCIELGGVVQGVSGEAAELLAGHGVVARLRYVPAPG